MRRLRHEFLTAGDEIIPIHAIESVDIASVEEERVLIRHNGRVTEARGFDAMEAVMTLKPSALEGRRLKWPKHMWALHNLVGHPVMQLLAFMHLYQAAMWVHDATVPAPRTLPKGPGIK